MEKLSNLEVLVFPSIFTLFEVEKKKAPDFSRALLKYFLEVEVKLELSWMWTQADVIHFFLTLPSNPSID